MVTMSAEVCQCGTQMQYTESNLLVCMHCDQGCLIQRDGGECEPCETFKARWQTKMQDIYGPGRGV